MKSTVSNPVQPDSDETVRMPRVLQGAFVFSLVALCWLGMMAVHEAGHVLGAILTHGSVNRVVLHPLTISRTDVSPNPSPVFVVWAGPIVGCLLPLAALAIPKLRGMIRRIAQFFVGFCLIANGAYIAIGSFEGIGDAGEMLRHGTPVWVMFAFGLIAVSCGFYLWHRLGSLAAFLANPAAVSPALVLWMTGVLIVVVVTEILLSP